jgi:hypothetical protein
MKIGTRYPQQGVNGVGPPSGRSCEAARGRAGSTMLGSRAFFSMPCAFANQDAPIKVLPFQGILCTHYVDF